MELMGFNFLVLRRRRREVEDEQLPDQSLFFELKNVNRSKVERYRYEKKKV